MLSVSKISHMVYAQITTAGTNRRLTVVPGGLKVLGFLIDPELDPVISLSLLEREGYYTLNEWKDHSYNETDKVLLNKVVIPTIDKEIKGIFPNYGVNEKFEVIHIMGALNKVTQEKVILPEEEQKSIDFEFHRKIVQTILKFNANEIERKYLNSLKATVKGMFYIEDLELIQRDLSHLDGASKYKDTIPFFKALNNKAIELHRAQLEEHTDRIKGVIEALNKQMIGRHPLDQLSQHSYVLQLVNELRVLDQDPLQLTPYHWGAIKHAYHYLTK